MYAYCVQELHLSEDAAYKRIQAARVARRFPSILGALACGRLHLTAVLVLAPYLTSGNVAGLVEVCAHKTKHEIEVLLAKRFPRTEVLAMVQSVPAARCEPVPATRCVSDPTVGGGRLGPEPVVEAPETLADVRSESCQLAPERVGTPTKVTPIAEGRFVVQAMIGQSTHDKLCYAQELLGHQLPSSEFAAVLDRALDAFIEKLEHRKFAATTKPRRVLEGGNNKSRFSPNANLRYIPARVKHEVWQRDGGRCTFMSQSGHRCESRKLIEFDHVQEVARGGTATVENLRLRCRAHNQYAAERTFGAGFMRGKRENGQNRRALEAWRGSDATRSAEARQAAEELITPLRLLGFRADETRRAAAHCETMAGASLQERVRRALAYLAPRTKCLPGA